MAVDTDKLAEAIAEAAEEYEKQYGHLPRKAKVTLSKSEDEPGELDQLAKELYEDDDGYTWEQAIAEVLGQFPELYDEELTKADPYDRERRDLFVDVERLADQLQVHDHNLSRAQAVAKAVSMRPEIYDRAVLMSARGTIQQETAR